MAKASPVKDLQDKLARSLADYANLEKRIESQRQLFTTLTATAIVSRMIEVLDDLHRANSHLKDDGLRLAIDKFASVLKSEGLEEIEVDGREFDPKTMECVNVADGKQNHVVSVTQKGYLLNGEVIRPAKVIVGRGNITKPS